MRAAIMAREIFRSQGSVMGYGRPLLWVASMACAALPAMAQVADADLEEVVVTATRRPTLALQTPVSMTVLGADTLDAVNADADEGFLYLLQFVGLDNRLNLFHMVSFSHRLRLGSVYRILGIAQKSKFRDIQAFLLRLLRHSHRLHRIHRFEHHESGPESPRGADRGAHHLDQELLGVAVE